MPKTEEDTVIPILIRKNLQVLAIYLALSLLGVVFFLLQPGFELNPFVILMAIITPLTIAATVLMAYATVRSIYYYITFVECFNCTPPSNPQVWILASTSAADLLRHYAEVKLTHEARLREEHETHCKSEFQALQHMRAGWKWILDQNEPLYRRAVAAARFWGYRVPADPQLIAKVTHTQLQGLPV